MTISYTTCTVPVQAPESDEVQHVAVVAEATGTPGLVIVPALGHSGVGGFTGDWVLTHASSGRRLPLGPHGDLPDLRRVATELGKTPVDWTADMDTAVAQATEHKAAVNSAVRAGLYPAPEPSDQDHERGTGPAPYPLTEAQATADAIAQHLVHAAQHRCAETWNLTGAADEAGKRLHIEHASALVAEWGLAYALREFAKVDQQAADHVARQIWAGWDDGGTVHEMTGEWANAYGLPPVETAPRPAPATVTVKSDVL